MRVTQLKLTNLRAIEAAEFRFQAGFNLIVGENGVGKTSVLEALAISLSAIVRQANGLRAKSGAFLNGDIRKGARALTAECSIHLDGHEYDYLIHKSLSSGEVQAAKTGLPREQALDTPDRAEFVGETPKPLVALPLGGRPLGIFFSTRRAVSSSINRSKGSASGGIVAACAEAFSQRELRLSEFAEWMRAQAALKEEQSAFGQVLEAFENTTQQFLPGYQNIRPTDEATPRLLIDHGKKTVMRVEDLSDRERARLKEAIQWADTWMALNWTADPEQTEAELQRASASTKSAILADALTRFLPYCENLRLSDADAGMSLIDRNPTTIEVAQLSDGERGALALVLDLTRRLAQANPEMNAPAAEAEAVVLIDEIDLHLHPKWQRQIVSNLTGTFPRCQFIATTHSPQVIGEVEHDRIQIIANGQVYSPTHSFGVDSSRVLEEIMDADPRTHEVKELLSQLSREVGDQRFDSARMLLAQLVNQLGESDAEVTRVRTLLEFMEGD